MAGTKDKLRKLSVKTVRARGGVRFEGSESRDGEIGRFSIRQ